MKIPAGTPNIEALKNAVHSLVELTESKGTINGSREEFQGRLQSVEMIKWAIICEATSLVMNGELDKAKEREEKYHHAVLVLQAIAGRSGKSKDGCFDEWTEAEAFRDCREAAKRALRRIGEPENILNKKGDDDA